MSCNVCLVSSFALSVENVMRGQEEERSEMSLLCDWACNHIPGTSMSTFNVPVTT